MARVGLGVVVVVEGKLDLREHEVVGLIVAGVSAEDHVLDRMVLPRRLGAVGEPLHGEGGPFERVGDDKVVEEERGILPDLVLLVDEAVLHLDTELLPVRRPAGLRHRRSAGARARVRVWEWRGFGQVRERLSEEDKNGCGKGVEGGRSDGLKGCIGQGQVRWATR